MCFFRLVVGSKIFKKCIIIITWRNFTRTQRLRVNHTLSTYNSTKIKLSTWEMFEYWVWIVIISGSRAHPALDLENYHEVPKRFNWSLNALGRVVRHSEEIWKHNYYCTMYRHGLKIITILYRGTVKLNVT